MTKRDFFFRIYLITETDKPVQYSWAFSSDDVYADDDDYAGEAHLLVDLPVPDGDASTAEQMFAALMRNYVELSLTFDDQFRAEHPAFFTMQMVARAFFEGASWARANPQSSLPARNPETGEFLRRF